MAGLLAAQRAMRQWASGTVPRVELLGIVLIADAPGRVPRAMREFAEVLEGGIPQRWDLPWEEAWRFREPDDAPKMNRGVRELLNDLASLVAN